MLLVHWVLASMTLAEEMNRLRECVKLASRASGVRAGANARHLPWPPELSREVWTAPHMSLEQQAMVRLATS